jgi:hypoxanthine phosphoribosyltransferase
MARLGRLSTAGLPAGFWFALRAGSGKLAGIMAKMHDDVAEVLLTEQQIQQRLDVLAAQLRADYEGKDLTVIGVLTGSVLFLADLLRRLPIPLRLDYIAVSSYHGGTRSSHDLVVTKTLRLDVRDRDVLVVDDILDTGQTLTHVRDMMRGYGPRDVKYCVFLEKNVPHAQKLRPDYVGFQISDQFVVGYGLDYRERYRNLMYVATLKPEVIAVAP